MPQVETPWEIQEETPAPKKRARGGTKEPRFRKFDKDDQETLIQWRLECNLTPAMKLRRQRFVASYLVDHVGTYAAIRMGIDAKSAKAEASKMLKEPYVQELLADAFKEIKEDYKDLNKWIIYKTRELACHYDPQIQTANLKNLAQMTGLIGPAKIDINAVTNVTNNVMVVPAASTPDDWELQASESQKQLKDDVRL